MLILLDLESEEIAKLDKLVRKPGKVPRCPFAQPSLARMSKADQARYFDWKKEWEAWKARPYKSRVEAVKAIVKKGLA